MDGEDVASVINLCYCAYLFRLPDMFRACFLFTLFLGNGLHADV
jgi:hypothetical protein